MSDVKVVRIGLGEVVSNWGTYEGIPALFIEPATRAGIVGEKEFPDSEEIKTDVRDGGIILQFHNANGADILIEDINSALGRQSA